MPKTLTIVGTKQPNVCRLGPRRFGGGLGGAVVRGATCQRYVPHTCCCSKQARLSAQRTPHKACAASVVPMALHPRAGRAVLVMKFIRAPPFGEQPASDMFLLANSFIPYSGSMSDYKRESQSKKNSLSLVISSFFRRRNRQMVYPAVAPSPRHTTLVWARVGPRNRESFCEA